jgi:hypothetical protein
MRLVKNIVMALLPVLFVLVCVMTMVAPLIAMGFGQERAPWIWSIPFVGMILLACSIEIGQVYDYKGPEIYLLDDSLAHFLFLEGLKIIFSLLFLGFFVWVVWWLVSDLFSLIFGL